MNMRNLFLPATALSLALAACSQPAETDKTATASYDGEVASEDKAADKRPPAIKPTDVPTRGGDGSPIELAALTEADVSGAQRKGELACSFGDDEGPKRIRPTQAGTAPARDAAGTG